MARREVNLFQAALGMTLFATIAMPIVPDGPSLLDVLLQVARDNPLGALTMLLMFGSPQLFGLAVGIAGLTREDAVARAAVTSMVALMQGMLVMLGVGIVGGNVVAPVGLFDALEQRKLSVVRSLPFAKKELSIHLVCVAYAGALQAAAWANDRAVFDRLGHQPEHRLHLDLRLATWDLRPWADDADFAVSILRRRQ